MHHLRTLWFFPRLLNYWHSSIRLRRAVLLVLVTLLVALLMLVRPPSDFPKNELLIVRDRASIMETGEYLHDHHVITSPLLFSLFIKFFNPENGVLSGAYYFAKPIDLVTVAYRIAKGKSGLTPFTVTIPEGSSIFQIGEIISRVVPDFDTEQFIALSKEHEGYLFPDTYYFLPTVKPEEVVSAMQKAFDTKIGAVEKEIREYG